MKVGDLVRPHPGIPHPWTEDHPGPWIGVILELRGKEPPRVGSRQGAVVMWSAPVLQEKMQWTYTLEVINESR